MRTHCAGDPGGRKLSASVCRMEGDCGKCTYSAVCLCVCRLCTVERLSGALSRWVSSQTLWTCVFVCELASAAMRSVVRCVCACTSSSDFSSRRAGDEARHCPADVSVSVRS